jgi:adiponectin receptor
MYGRHPQKFDNPDPELQKQWLELKEVLCDNEYMIGYKIMIGRPISFASVFDVLTTVHTDTSNIWSHLLGFLVCFYIGFGAPLPVAITALCSALTYAFSTTYHIFRNFSRAFYDICLFFDVSAIAVQVFGFLFSDLSVFFPTRPEVAGVYYIVLTVLFVVSVGAFPFILKYKVYWVRTLLLLVDSTLFLPILLHKIYYDGFTDQILQFIPRRALCLVSAVSGIVIRSAHVPERFFPRTIWQTVFHSHFIFHMLSVIASLFGVWSAQAFV